MGDYSRANDMDTFMDLYIFADMARIPSLMNLVVDDVQELSDDLHILPATGVFSRMWSNIYDSSLFRHLIVDWIVWEGSESYFNDTAYSIYPQDMTVAILKAQNTVMRGYLRDEEPTSPLRTSNNYHVLDDV